MKVKGRKGGKIEYGRGRLVQKVGRMDLANQRGLLTLIRLDNTGFETLVCIPSVKKCVHFVVCSCHGEVFDMRLTET